MKPRLLLLLSAVFSLTARAQLQLSDFGGGAAEGAYISLYNPAMTAQQNTGCYTLAVPFQTVTSRGLYLLQLPDLVLPPGRRLVLTTGERTPYYASTEGDYKVNMAGTARDQAWVKRFTLLPNGTYNTEPAQLNELMGAARGGNLLIFQNNRLVSGRNLQSGSAFLPASVQSLPPLKVPGSCGLLQIDLARVTPSDWTTAQIVNEEAAPATELEQFTVSRTRTEAELVWLISADQQLRGFEIQRQLGGSGWTTVGYVGAMEPDARSGQTLQYLYSDPLRQPGAAQYRLRQIDAYGKAVYSPVRALESLNSANGLLVYPNPSPDGRFTVLMDEGQSLHQIQLIDLSGRLVRQWVSANRNRQSLENIRPGNYVLRVIDQPSGTVRTEKVVVTE